MYLLDTNVIIRYLNGRSPNIKEKMGCIKPSQLKICSVVKAELFYGALKSQNPTKNLNEQHVFINRFESLSFNDKSAFIYGQVRVNLEKKGLSIGNNDMMIAAIAMADNLILVTGNTREFSRINGLRIENWE